MEPGKPKPRQIGRPSFAGGAGTSSVPCHHATFKMAHPLRLQGMRGLVPQDRWREKQVLDGRQIQKRLPVARVPARVPVQCAVVRLCGRRHPAVFAKTLFDEEAGETRRTDEHPHCAPRAQRLSDGDAVACGAEAGLGEKRDHRRLRTEIAGRVAGMLAVILPDGPAERRPDQLQAASVSAWLWSLR